jgi:DNA-binding MarR family transcriptional regulator
MIRSVAIVSTCALIYQGPVSKMNSEEFDEHVELVHRSIRRLMAEPQALLAEKQLGRAHHRALFYIRREDGISVGDLAARMAITTQALHKTLRDLIERRLVKSVPKPANRRYRQLTLTESGRRFEAQISGLQRALFAKVSARLGEAEIARWATVASTLADT